MQYLSKDLKKVIYNLVSLNPIYIFVWIWIFYFCNLKNLTKNEFEDFYFWQYGNTFGVFQISISHRQNINRAHVIQTRLTWEWRGGLCYAECDTDTCDTSVKTWPEGPVININGWEKVDSYNNGWQEIDKISWVRCRRDNDSDSSYLHDAFIVSVGYYMDFCVSISATQRGRI